MNPKYTNIRIIHNIRPHLERKKGGSKIKFFRNFFHTKSRKYEGRGSKIEGTLRTYFMDGSLSWFVAVWDEYYFIEVARITSVSVQKRKLCFEFQFQYVSIYPIYSTLMLLTSDRTISIKMQQSCTTSFFVWMLHCFWYVTWLLIRDEKRKKKDLCLQCRKIIEKKLFRYMWYEAILFLTWKYHLALIQDSRISKVSNFQTLDWYWF